MQILIQQVWVEILASAFYQLPDDTYAADFGTLLWGASIETITHELSYSDPSAHFDT